MAALTADTMVETKNPTKHGIEAVGADTFYGGALVFGDATNGKAQVVPAAGDVFLGICAQQKVVEAADEIVEVYCEGMALLPIDSVAQSNVGDTVFLDIGTDQSDNPADLSMSAPGGEAGLAANDILIGKIISIQDGKAWVRLDPGKLYDATSDQFV